MDRRKLLQWSGAASALLSFLAPTLKQQLPGLLPPHVLTSAEKARVLSEVLSIVGETPAEFSQRPPDHR